MKVCIVTCRSTTKHITLKKAEWWLGLKNIVPRAITRHIGRGKALMYCAYCHACATAREPSYSALTLLNAFRLFRLNALFSRA